MVIIKQEPLKNKNNQLTGNVQKKKGGKLRKRQQNIVETKIETKQENPQPPKKKIKKQKSEVNKLKSIEDLKSEKPNEKGKIEQESKNEDTGTVDSEKKPLSNRAMKRIRSKEDRSKQKAISDDELVAYKTEDEVREALNALVAESKLAETKIDSLIGRWYKVCNAKDTPYEFDQKLKDVSDFFLKKYEHQIISDEELNDCSTIADVKTKLSILVSEGKLEKKDVQALITRWNRRDKRRLLRQKEREKACFGCRQTGHLISECPNKTKDGELIRERHVTGICFRCGSTEHRLRECTSKAKGLPYAHCYVCQRQGHIARDCEENPNGIYPNGGACYNCGANNHRKNACPQLSGGVKQKDKPSNLATVADPNANPDEEVCELQKSKDTPQKTGMKKKAKIVKIN